MTLDEYAQFCLNNRIKPKKFDTMVEALLALPNEVGELLDHYKKFYRDDRALNKYEVIFEMGDVLHSIIAIIALEGYSPQFILEQNVKKLTKRNKPKKKMISKRTSKKNTSACRMHHSGVECETCGVRY